MVQGHDALVAVPFPGVQGDHDPAFAEQLEESGVVGRHGGLLGQAGDGTQLAAGVGLGHQQRQGAVTAHLDAQGAVELDGIGEQRHRGEQLAQQAVDHRRIGVAVEHLGIGQLEGHEFTAYVGVVEEKTLDLVAHRVPVRSKRATRL